MLRGHLLIDLGLAVAVLCVWFAIRQDVSSKAISRNLHQLNSIGSRYSPQSATLVAALGDVLSVEIAALMAAMLVLSVFLTVATVALSVFTNLATEIVVLPRQAWVWDYFAASRDYGRQFSRFGWFGPTAVFVASMAMFVFGRTEQSLATLGGNAILAIGIAILLFDYRLKVRMRFFERVRNIAQHGGDFMRLQLLAFMNLFASVILLLLAIGFLPALVGAGVELPSRYGVVRSGRAVEQFAASVISQKRALPELPALRREVRDFMNRPANVAARELPIALKKAGRVAAPRMVLLLLIALITTVFLPFLQLEVKRAPLVAFAFVIVVVASEQTLHLVGVRYLQLSSESLISVAFAACGALVIGEFALRTLRRLTPNTVLCSWCHRENEANAIFCIECGAPVWVVGTSPPLVLNRGSRVLHTLNCPFVRRCERRNLVVVSTPPNVAAYHHCAACLRETTRPRR